MDLEEHLLPNFATKLCSGNVRVFNHISNYCVYTCIHIYIHIHIICIIIITTIIITITTMIIIIIITITLVIINTYINNNYYIN